MNIAKFIEQVGGLSVNTRKSYEQTLWQLKASIGGDEPTDDEIFTYLKRYPSSSLHRHKAAIKAYLEFSDRKRVWPFNRRSFTLRRRQIPVYVPPKVVPDIARAGDRDDYMFVWTLFQLGCRISELRGILKEDIGAAGIKMMTKGGWAKLKPITKEFREELLAYVRGKKGKIFPRPYNYYKKRLAVLAKQAGYTERITPHMLRHARAVDLLNRGMPLPYVQQFLGHVSIQTTAVYLEITGGELGEHLERVESGEEGVQAILARLSPNQISRLREVLGENGGAAVVNGVHE